MALTIKKVHNYCGATGTPVSDTAYDKIDFGFDAKCVKIVVKQGSTAALDMSLDGKDVFNSLPVPEANQNALIYDFQLIGISRLFLRKTGASIELMAYGLD